MTKPQRPAEEALETVRRRLSATPVGEPPSPNQMRETWVVRPFRDATIVAPRNPKRGAPLFLVRGVDLVPIHSARRQTMDQIYEELAARQGG